MPVFGAIFTVLMAYLRTAFGWLLSNVLIAGTAIFARFFAYIFGNIFLSWGIKYFIRFGALAWLVTVTLAFLTLVHLTVFALSIPTIPDWLAQGMSIILPPATIPCLNAYFVIRVAAWAYSVNSRFLEKAIDFATKS